MSRDDWSFLEHLLEEGQEYSTSMGRVWLTVLFLFRMLVLGTAAESAWDDEQADFVCNTQQPGCTAVCYDRAFPISHFRYFVLQVIFVSTPTIFYCGYVVVQAREDDGKEVSGAGDGEEETAIAQGGAEAEREDKNERVQEEDKQEAVKGLKEGNAVPMVPKLKGGLLGAYAFSILLTFLLEAGFIAGLWVLYGGFVIAAKFECVASPCPHTVDCFASRPTEKTIFTIYTQAIAAVSLLLNLVELFHLLQLAVSHRLEKRYSAKGLTVQSWRVEAPGQAAQVGGATSYRERSHLYLPMGGEGAGHSVPCDGYVEVRAEVNWVPGEAADDLLPTYLNCMGGLGGMRSAHSPRAHHKKHAHGNGKHSNGKHSNGKHSNGKHSPGAHRGHPKQKHYV